MGILDPYWYSNWGSLMSNFEIHVEHLQYEDEILVSMRHSLNREVAFGARCSYNRDKYEQKFQIKEVSKLLADMIFEKCKHNVGEYANG